MLAIEPPEGFQWRWDGDSVRVQLPEMQVTRSHCFEPMLPRGIVVRLARALEALAPRRVGKEGNAPRPALQKITLAHDARYQSETIEKFTDRLVTAIGALGLDPQISHIAVQPVAAAPDPVRTPPPPAEAPEESAPIASFAVDESPQPERAVDPAAETDSGTEPDFLTEKTETPPTTPVPATTAPSPAKERTRPATPAAPRRSWRERLQKGRA